MSLRMKLIRKSSLLRFMRSSGERDTIDDRRMIDDGNRRMTDDGQTVFVRIAQRHSWIWDPGLRRRSNTPSYMCHLHINYSSRALQLSWEVALTFVVGRW